MSAKYKQYMHWVHGCKFKQKHSTYEGALANMFSLWRRDKTSIGKVHTYLCGFCGFYHIGRSSSKTLYGLIGFVYKEIKEGQRDDWEVMEYYRLRQKSPYTLDAKRVRA